jgi:adenine-specific DNA-methyltransferase
VAAIDDLLQRISDKALRNDLAREIKTLRAGREYGLVFENHLPERVRLPGHAIRTGLSVIRRVDPETLGWTVTDLRGGRATICRLDENGLLLEEAHGVDELIVVKDFAEAIHPGLKRVGRVELGGDKPFHTVINGENYHVLETLLYVAEGQVDCIYIDPPYNTGATDWKYNNNYVDSQDAYRHSKWLSFMNRRLKLAGRLMRPDRSVLLITIDDNEVHSLSLLLDQLFPNSEKQMVSITISPRGKSRDGRLSQVDEYLIIVYVGSATVNALQGEDEETEVRWRGLRRTDIESARTTRPRQFYPIYVHKTTGKIVEIGQPLAHTDPIDSIPRVEGAVGVLPIRKDGIEMNWSLVGKSLRSALEKGYVRVGAGGHARQPYTFSYLTHPAIRKVERGIYKVAGTRPDGSKVVIIPGGKVSRPTTTWREKRHDAGAYGTSLLRSLLPGRRFPFPKSLYAVEDTLRLFVTDNPDALVLDFFAGSGTTAHALARLNQQDGGRRRSILVTNNEVSQGEAREMRKSGLNPGDPAWEDRGIFCHITVPRLISALTGRTPKGDKVAANYKFSGERPISEGLAENMEFYELTYEDRDRVSLGSAFEAIAPILWLKAGAVGPQIEEVKGPWTLPAGSRYGILFDTAGWRPFIDAVKASEDVTHVYLITDSETVFQQLVRELPAEVSPIRLYQDYLGSFEINTGGIA